MASASSSTPPCKYDVFISFRGKDVRLGFLSHLCTALQEKQINAFLDEELHKGEEISSALLKIIEESIVSIVIFSENYADSPWCLDELVKILECKETLGQLVLPVFYHVDPTDVQDLTGNFGKSFALAKRGEQVKGCSHKWKHALTEVLRVNFQQAFAIVVHGEHVQDCVPKVDRWKRALMEVSKVAGWDSRNIMPESKLVEEIVNDVLKKFSGTFSSDDSYDRNLVGIESRVKKVEQLLNDKTVVGLWGMAGIGKTTIAQEVFRRNMMKFDGHCFLDKVREKTIKQLRNIIIRQLLREKKLLEDTLFWGTFIRSRLKGKKILIVFDDVDDADQLKNLVGEHDLYGVGSRIVVTSRDQQVLENFCPKECIYEVEKLTYPEDLELFSLHAFQQNHPKEGYMELSQKAITYAGGNPLALKVLGSHLFGMGIEEWKGELKKLNGQSLKKIQDVLKISYDGLERNEKEIFLDIACFFSGERTAYVERVLEACGFHPKGAIHRLFKKSLISDSDMYIEMHDLLRQMGKDIIIKECKQPGGRSRLWNYEDIDHLFTANTGTESVEGIILESTLMNEVDRELSPTAFTKMPNLRIMKVCDRGVLLPNNLEFLPQELRYLGWDFYPSTSLPSNFCLKNLVQLRMHCSKLRQLWHGNEPLENLIILDLLCSEDLIGIPDLSNTAPNLEVLRLRGCRSLTEIPSSLQNLRKLTVLRLDRCCKVTCCPEIPCSIRFLHLEGTGIEQLPSSIEHLTQLRILPLQGCKRLVSIPSGISELKCLISLDLGGCSNLTSLPESIKQVSKLEFLYLSGCERLECLPDLPSSLEALKASNCTSLKSASTSFLLEDHDGGFCKKKLLQFGNCFNLEDKKKVIEDVIERHLLGQNVGLCMVGGEVPEWMRYMNKIGSSLSFKLDLRHLIAFSFCAILPPKNYDYPFLTCRMDLTDESGHRHSYEFSPLAFLFYPMFLSSEHMVLWLCNEEFESVDEKCIVEASFHFEEDTVKIIKCGIHPIYSRKRSRNEEHQDDGEHQPAFQRLEDEKDNNIKRRRINFEEKE